MIVVHGHLQLAGYELRVPVGIFSDVSAGCLIQQVLFDSGKDLVESRATAFVIEPDAVHLHFVIIRRNGLEIGTRQFDQFLVFLVFLYELRGHQGINGSLHLLFALALRKYGRHRNETDK